MKIAIIIPLTFIISGCASTGPQYTNFWKKEGHSYEQAKSGEANCKFQVGLAKIEGYLENKELLKSCMMKDDYRMGRYLLSKKI